MKQNYNEYSGRCSWGNSNICVLGGHFSGKSTLLANLACDSMNLSSKAAKYKESLYVLIKNSEGLYSMKLNMSNTSAVTLHCLRSENIDDLSICLQNSEHILLCIPNSNTEIPNRILAQCILGRFYGIKSIIIHLTKLDELSNDKAVEKLNNKLIEKAVSQFKNFGFEQIYVQENDNRFDEKIKEVSIYSYDSLKNLFSNIEEVNNKNKNDFNSTEKTKLNIASFIKKEEEIEDEALTKLLNYLVSSLKSQKDQMNFKNLFEIYQKSEEALN